MKKTLFVMALLASTSAHAQSTAPTGQPQQNPENVSPTDPGGETQPGEIVVTAAKREQALQDVSAAVSAIGAEQLQTKQINNLGDLQAVVPSVNFGNDFNQAKIFIRGVGANTSTTGSSTGVALHVDGAYVARAEAQLTSLFDLERVEVLRGPQGTLYGRNAVGGSINLITAKPTRELSGYARVSYGNYNQIITEGAISGPIVPGVLFRIAEKTENRDGFGHNPATGRDVDDLNRRMIRGQLQFDLGGRGDSLLLEGDYFRQDDHSGAIHYLRAAFPGVPRLAPLGVGGYATKPRDYASENDPGTQTDSYSGTATLHLGLTDSLSITDIGNYRRFKSSLFQDLDLSAVIDSLPSNGKATTWQERRIDSTQWSNELQFNYDTTFIHGVLGLYYFQETQHPIDNVGLAPRNGLATNIAKLQAAGVDLNEAYFLCGYSPDTETGGTTVIAPKRVCTRSNLFDKSGAAFGQATFDLGGLTESLSGLSIKLGGRYSVETVMSENPSNVITANGAGAVLHYTAAGTHRQRTFRDFTPEAGLEWKPARGVLVYYTYSEGFKAGAGENASGSTHIVDPENIVNHELGLKASLNRTLTTNIAVYHYNLSGAQLNKTFAGGPTGYTTSFENAAETEATGFEAETFWRPFTHLNLSGAVSYTDAHFVKYTTLDPLDPRNIVTPGAAPYNAATNPTGPCTPANCPDLNLDLSGNPTRNSPRWAWNLHGDYTIDAPSLGGTITPSIDVSHKSRTYFSEFQRLIESSAPYTQLDMALLYEGADRHFTAQLWVKNATDMFRAGSTFALATGRLIGATWLPPRTFGGTVGYKF